MTSAPANPPAVNAPPVVVGLIGALVLCHVLVLGLGPEWREVVVGLLGVVPARFTVAGLSLFSLQGLIAAVSLAGYTFLHGGWLHLGINAIWLLALGSGVARRLGAGRFLLFYFACGVLAGLTYVAIQPASTVPAIGASGAVSGLLGGVIRFLADGPGGRRGLASLRDRRVVVLVVFWVALNVAFGRNGLSSLTGGQPIAWEAHLGGFLAGLILIGLFDPPISARRLRNYPPSDAGP